MDKDLYDRLRRTQTLQRLAQEQALQPQQQQLQQQQKQQQRQPPPRQAQDPVYKHAASGFTLPNRVPRDPLNLREPARDSYSVTRGPMARNVGVARSSVGLTHLSGGVARSSPGLARGASIRQTARHDDRLSSGAAEEEWGGGGDDEIGGAALMPLAPAPLDGSSFPPWFNDLVRDLSNASTGKQVAVGVTSGWCSGYLFGKISKVAVLTVGGSLIFIALAQNQGLIEINWGNIQRSVTATRDRLTNQVASSAPAFADLAQEFARRHAFLAGSYVIGFLLGVAI